MTYKSATISLRNWCNNKQPCRLKLLTSCRARILLHMAHVRLSVIRTLAMVMRQWILTVNSVSQRAPTSVWQIRDADRLQAFRSVDNMFLCMYVDVAVERVRMLVCFERESSKEGLDVTLFGKGPDIFRF